MIFVKIFLLNNFDFLTAEIFYRGSREIFHRYRNLDIPVVTRSSTFDPTTCRKFSSWFIRILARVFWLLEEI